MKTFKIGNQYVESENESDAHLIKNLIDSKSNSQNLIAIRTGDKLDIIEIPHDGTVEVYQKSGLTIKFCGKIQGGTGYRIIQSAIDLVKRSDKERAQLSNSVKRANLKNRHNLDKSAIDSFESTIPENVKILFTKVMKSIGATTEAYKLEIIESINSKGIFSLESDQWFPVLSWFNNKVIKENDEKAIEHQQSHYALRSAFITTLIRIVGDGKARHANMMRLASQIDDHSNDFWKDYAEKQE